MTWGDTGGFLHMEQATAAHSLDSNFLSSQILQNQNPLVEPLEYPDRTHIESHRQIPSIGSITLRPEPSPNPLPCCPKRASAQLQSSFRQRCSYECGRAWQSFKTPKDCLEPRINECGVEAVGILDTLSRISTHPNTMNNST